MDFFPSKAIKVVLIFNFVVIQITDFLKNVKLVSFEGKQKIFKKNNSNDLTQGVKLLKVFGKSCFSTDPHIFLSILCSL